MKIFEKYHLFVGLACVAITGCAAPKAKPIVWPSPPDAPRVKFVTLFNTDKELFGTSWQDVVVGTGASGFRKPAAAHIDNRGRLYVSDTGLGLVHIFDLKNKKKTAIGGLGKPVGVTSGSDGKVYVTDTSSDRIMVYGADDEFIYSLGKPGELEQPTGIVMNNNLDRLYVVDTHKHNVAVFSPKKRKKQFEFGERGDGDGQFNFPSNIAIDNENNVYVVDTINGRVQIFDADGNFLDKFGRLGDAPGAFSRPKGIALDPDGNIYVVDSAFNNVQMFNKSGRILMGFAGFGEGRGGMILPSGIAIDENATIYVTDQWNARVSVYQFLNKRYWEKNPDEKKELFKYVEYGESDYVEE
ncbi:MAG: 6-bladed beta-propeller [Nitrospinota bacterium]